MNRSDLTPILSALLVLALVFALTACAAKTVEPVPEPEVTAPEPTPEPETEPEPEPVLRDDLVGISLPDKELRRWAQDGIIMESLLEQAGYEADLQFAGYDPSMQISQLENMVENGAKAIIVAAVDGDALGTVLDQAKEAGCTIIAYDRSIRSDAVNYYIAFDWFSVFAAQGKFIVDQLDLDNADDRVYNIELFGASPDDYNFPYVVYDGVMSQLEKYIDAGTLNVVSGQVDTENTSTEGWSAEKAKERLEMILFTYYADKQLDAVWCANDSIAQGIAAALENVYENDVYPIITGWDCDIASVKNILDGKQAMSVFMDTRNLAAKAAEMTDAVIRGVEPPTSAEFTTADGAYSYLAFYCDPTVVTRDNIRETLIDSGYYTAGELGLEP